MSRKRIWQLASCLLVSIVLLASFSCVKPASGPAPSPTPSPSPKPQTVEWKFSSWGTPRTYTYAADEWAKDMEALTQGRWKIKMYYGEVLAKQNDNPDGIKAGLFEASIFSSSYYPSKMPLYSVLDLPPVCPLDIRQAGALVFAVSEHSAAMKEMDALGAVTLFPLMGQPYVMASNKRITKVEDFQGLRVRAFPDQAKLLEQFGAKPTTIPTTEIYGALERGTVDAAITAWTSGHIAWRTNEVTKYAILGVPLGIGQAVVVVRKQAWTSLPDEFKQLSLWWGKTKALDLEARVFAEGDAKDMPRIMKNMELVTLNEGELAKMETVSAQMMNQWVEKRNSEGLPGKAFLEYVLAKR